MFRPVFNAFGRAPARFATTLATLLALAALLAAPAAHADIFGFIDGDGVIHFANDKVDERYQLFFKDGELADSARIPARGGLQDQAAPDADILRSKFFQRVVDHPNISKFEPLIQQAVHNSGIDLQLVKSVIAVESGYEPGAVSPKGAVGLMQVLPATGERYGLRADKKHTVEQKLADPETNLRIGVRYLSDLKAMFAGDRALMLAAYNAGENAVKRYSNKIPPYPETQAYVKMVEQFYTFYKPKFLEAPRRIRISVPARRNMPESVTASAE